MKVRIYLYWMSVMHIFLSTPAEYSNPLLISAFISMILPLECTFIKESLDRVNWYLYWSSSSKNSLC